MNNDIWDECKKDNDLKKASELLSGKYGENISEEKAKSWYKAYLLAEESGLPELTFSNNPCAEKKVKTWVMGNWKKLYLA